jgi:hypothetical protein
MSRVAEPARGWRERGTAGRRGSGRVARWGGEALITMALLVLQLIGAAGVAVAAAGSSVRVRVSAATVQESAPGTLQDPAPAPQADWRPSATAPPSRITGGNFIVEFWPAQQRLAERVLRLALETRLPALPEDVLASPPPVTIQLAPDEASFAALTGGLAPHWGAGVAFSQAGLIVIPTSRAATGSFESLGRVVVHELAHIALHRHLAPARIPRWFNEGYSTWAAGQLDLEAGWLLRVAFLTNRAPPLDSLVIGWPDEAIDARVAYLLSASVIRFLHDRGGDFALRRFLERWASGVSMEQALFQTYGLTIGLLERDWTRDVRRRYGWLTFFAQGVVIWTILGILVLALFAIRRRRDRKRLARLAADELPEQPAFWTDEWQQAEAAAERQDVPPEREPGHPPEAAPDDPPDRGPRPPPGRREWEWRWRSGGGEPRG